MTASRAIRTGLAAVGAATLLAACGSSAPKANPQILLQKAKAVVDGATAAHFNLTSKNVSLSSTNLVGGSGDLVRPDSLQGQFSVAVNGFTVNVGVVSVGGVFEAKPPFYTRYQKTDPASYGLADPAQLFDRQKGLSSLLTLAQDPKLGPATRSGGELLDTVTYTIPGSSIPVLPDVNPAQPVTMTVAIDPTSYQLRTVTLVGPFTTDKYNSTFVLTLDHYNEHVVITLPPTS